VRQIGQGMTELIDAESDALANSQRRGVVVDAKGKDHGCGQNAKFGGRL
jgi:hypothetical protein